MNTVFWYRNSQPRQEGLELLRLAYVRLQLSRPDIDSPSNFDDVLATHSQFVYNQYVKRETFNKIFENSVCFVWRFSEDYCFDAYLQEVEVCVGLRAFASWHFVVFTGRFCTCGYQQLWAVILLASVCVGTVSERDAWLRPLQSEQALCNRRGLITCLIRWVLWRVRDSIICITNAKSGRHPVWSLRNPNSEQGTSIFCCSYLSRQLVFDCPCYLSRECLWNVTAGLHGCSQYVSVVSVAWFRGVIRQWCSGGSQRGVRFPEGKVWCELLEYQQGRRRGLFFDR